LLPFGGKAFTLPGSSAHAAELLVRACMESSVSHAAGRDALFEN
jgi:hypothetical protein